MKKTANSLEVEPFDFEANGPQFSDASERRFQKAYYIANWRWLRMAALLLALLFGIYAYRDFHDTASLFLASRVNGAPGAFFFLLFLLTSWKGFSKFWQPIVLTGALVVSLISLDGLSIFILNAPHVPLPPASSSTSLTKGLPPVPPDSPRTDSQAPAPLLAKALPAPPAGNVAPFSTGLLFFSLQLSILMICFAALRLRFVWTLAMQSGVVCIGVWTFSRHTMGDDPQLVAQVLRVMQPALLVLFAVLLAAYIQEQLARSSFAASRRLAWLQAQEEKKRLESERMLHVLAGAIGGIVHDIGTPLTLMQSGADTLRYVVSKDRAEPETMNELTSIISNGAQMLDFLRLSLIEQTRVLEGQPISIESELVSLRTIVEAGARFQKPNVVATHPLVIRGDDIVVRADEKRMVTVFMNLIGNALKYSDSRVDVTWRRAENRLLVAVLDCGRGGQGLTQEQASQLFVAFGRLEAHSQIEGTGLGLVSVQKVVEAHGGETFVEGFEDGSPPSPPFSTASRSYSSMLEGDFRSAFVISLPLETSKPD